MLKIEKIEYCADSKCSYVYFWPQDCDFIFELSTINLNYEGDGVINIDYTENGDPFGIELINFSKELIHTAISWASVKETLNIDLKNAPEITEH